MNIPDDYFDGQMSALDSSRTLFVGDLSFFCNEEDLFALFAPFGSILTVRVRRGITGESLMHGFIAMELPEAAKTAIGSIDGMEFMGRNIRVQLSSDGQRSAISKDSLVQVHVSFISKQNNFLITEKILRDLFSPFGTVADVAIKKHTAVPKQGRQSGYGFVYFFEPTGAYRAVQALKQNTVHDITLDCSISHKSETMIRQGQQQSGAPSHNSSFSAQRYDRAQGLIPYPTNNSSASVSPRSISPRSSSPRSVSPRSISPRLMTNEQTNTLGSNLSTKSYEELYTMGANSTGPNNLFQYEQRPGVSQLPIPPHQQMSFPNMKTPSPAQSLGNAYSYQQQLQQNQGNFAQQSSNGSLNDLTTDLSRFSLQGHSPNGAQKPSSSNLHLTYMQGNGKSAGGARTPPGSVPQQHQTRFSGYMDYAMQQPANHSQQQHQSLVSSFRGGFDDMPHFQQPLSQLPLSGSQSQLPSMHGSPRLGYSQTGFNPGSTDILSAATASIMHNTTSSSNGNSSFIPSAAGAMPTTTAFTELDSSNYGDFLQEMRMQKLRIQQQQQQQQQLQSQSQLGSQLGYLQQLSRSSDTGNESGTGNHLNTSNPSGSAGLVLFPSVSTSPRASSPRQLDTDGAFSSTQSTDSLLASLQSSHQPLSQSNLFAHNNSNNDDNDSGARKLSSSVQHFLLQDDERTPGVEEVRGEETEGDLLGAQTLRFVLEK